MRQICSEPRGNYFFRFSFSVTLLPPFFSRIEGYALNDPANLQWTLTYFPLPGLAYRSEWKSFSPWENLFPNRLNLLVVFGSTSAFFRTRCSTSNSSQNPFLLTKWWNLNRKFILKCVFYALPGLDDTSNREKRVFQVPKNLYTKFQHLKLMFGQKKTLLKNGCSLT